MRNIGKVKETLSALWISQYNLQSLVGMLQFASNVIKPGQPFLRRLYDGLAKPTERVWLIKAMKLDLLWWNTFLTRCNGLCLRPDYSSPERTLLLVGRLRQARVWSISSFRTGRPTIATIYGVLPLLGFNEEGRHSIQGNVCDARRPATMGQLTHPSEDLYPLR